MQARSLFSTIALVALTILTACSSPTGPETPTEASPGEPEAEPVATVLSAQVEQDTLRIYQDSTALNVEVRDQYGETMDGVEVTLETLAPDRFRVLAGGYVLAVTDTVHFRQGPDGSLLMPAETPPSSPDAPTSGRVRVSTTTEDGQTLADTVELTQTSPVWAVNLAPDAACFASMELISPTGKWRGLELEVFAFDAAGRSEAITSASQVDWQVEDASLVKVHPDSVNGPHTALAQGHGSGDTDIGATVGGVTDWTRARVSDQRDANGNVKCSFPGFAGSVRSADNAGVSVERATPSLPRTIRTAPGGLQTSADDLPFRLR